jgi:tetratricopeptide (TPR) repeat protein
VSIDRAKAQKAAQKYLAKGQIDRAIAEFEKVVQSDPNDARSLLKLGDLYTRRGDSKGAVATYRKVAAQYAAEGFFLKAVAVYKQILKLDGSDLGAHESLAEAYDKLSLNSDAIATYEHVADGYASQGKNDRAVKALGRLAELDKTNVAAWVRYAEALSKADRIDEACDAFRRGADLLKQAGRADDYIKVTERLLFHSHEDLDRARDLADLYLERDQPKAALLHLQTCFKADARHPATLSLLARSFLALGQAPKAVSVYKELARVHSEAGASAAEAEALRGVLAHAPDDAEAKRRLAELSSGGGEAIELIEGDELDEVMVVEEDDDADADASGSYPLSADLEREAQIARLMAECEVFMRYGLRDKVVPQLKRVLAIDPQHTDAREKLKETYKKRGENAEAIAQLLVLAEHAGDPGKARKYLEEAAELDPLHPQVIARLQHTLSSSGAMAAPVIPASSSSADDDDEDVIFVDEDEPGASPRPASLRPEPLDESDFSDLRSAPPRAPIAPLSPLRFEPPPAQPPAPDFDEDADTIQVTGLSSLPPPPVPEPPTSGLGPREMSLASALEGPADEVAFEGADDDEPELVLEADEPEAELEVSEPDAPEPSEAEEPPEGVVDAIEEADFYLGQQLFDEAREVLIEAMYEHLGDKTLKRKLDEIDQLEAGGGTASPAAEPVPVASPASVPPPAEDRSFALAAKLADHGGAGAGGPVDVGDVIHQFKEGVRRQVDKADTATHYDLGIAYMEMGLHAEAIDEFQLCLEGGDRKGTAHTMIGLSYVAKGEMEPALTHFQQALATGHQNPEEQLTLWFEIGNAYELLGKASEALVFYEKVEEIDPAFREVSLRIERLGVKKTEQQETDEFDTMFDNMIVKE